MTTWLKRIVCDWCRRSDWDQLQSYRGHTKVCTTCVARFKPSKNDIFKH